MFEGETIITGSRDPEHDLARALLSRGITGRVTMHDGNTGKPRTLINIEKAATSGALTAMGSPTVGSLMSVRRCEATAPKRSWCCRPCQWTMTRLLPDTTGGVVKV